MLDLHCHILPGVDDGAVDVHETVLMARDALAQGCRAVVGTSHLGEGLFNTSAEGNRSAHREALRALEAEGIALELFAGAENFFGPVAPEEFAEKAVPLGEAGRYVLVDFSLQQVPGNLGEAIRALRERGRRAVIAHPERNRSLQKDPTPLGEWIAAGALIQVNASSLLGYSGPEARREGVHLLESGAAHVLASDAHDRGARPFCLREGREVAARVVGAAEAARMTSERPWKIAGGEPLEVEPVVVRPRAGLRRIVRRFLEREP